ncbi:Epidermal growth factor receptor substrate 15 [Podila epigama]|nr:Epidermal growth factor receptor substrate 15 [Podila epigama]
MVQTVQAKALFDCNGDEESELSFLEGDILLNVKETAEEGWLHGTLQRTGEEGLFPENYVEVIEIEEPLPPQQQPVAPPQLPSRSPAVAPKPAIQSAANISSLPPFSPKPALPQRPATTTNLIQEQSNGGTNGVALPGLRPVPGPSALKPHQSIPSAAESPRLKSGPPLLPKRSNTLSDTTVSKSTSTSTVATIAPVSVKERMANLSKASAGSTPVPLPPRPATTTESLPVSPSPLVRSPLPSTAARPALPPRTLTDSPTPSRPTLLAGSEGDGQKLNLPPSTGPAPKLTTFARPRSARTAKSTEPVEPASNDVSTPPKLPSRNTTSTPPTPTLSRKPINTSSVRLSPGPLRHDGIGNTSAVAASTEALPTITRNLQPIPLPTRIHLTNGSVLANPGLQQTIGRPLSSSSARPDVPSPILGSRSLNNVGAQKTIPTEPRPMSTLSAPTLSAAAQSSNEKAPPLPARSNTFSSTPPMSAETPAYRLGMAMQQRGYNKGQGLDAMVESWGHASSAPTQSDQTVHSLPKMELASSDCGMPPAARRRYEALFRKLCTGQCIDGAKVHEIYIRSRLDSRTLAQIWELVDIDNTGKLTKAQFCMGLYLIDERLASGTIPLEVSDELWVSVMN